MNTLDLLKYCHEMLSEPSKIEHIQSRNIVSRAYYFTYYECVNHVAGRLGCSETNLKGGVHNRMLSRLLDTTNIQDERKHEEAALIYTKMNNLKKLRVRADYKLEVEIPRSTAEYCVMEAENIALDLSSL